MSPPQHANRSATLERLRPLLGQPPVAALVALPRRFEAHVVGGALRDRLLGGRPRDFDAVVGGDGERAAERLAESLGLRWFRLGGDRFAAYRLEAPEFRLDLWDRRPMTVEEDLGRRDLTVNSIALRLADLEILDPLGGLEDLDRRRLRATSESSFSEDPLRVLRLVRFAIGLPGFGVTARTRELALEAAPRVASVAGERVREELRALFTSGRPDAAIELLAQLDLYPALWTGESESEAAPPLERLRRFQRRSLDLAGLPRPREVDALVGTQAVLLDELPNGAAHLKDLQTRHLIANREARAVGKLLEWRGLPAREPDHRWLLHRSGELWPTLAAFLGSAADDRAWRESLETLDRLATHDAEGVFAPPPLLDGHRIAALAGLEPGPRLGRLAGALRRAQVEGRVASPEEATELIRSLSASWPEEDAG